MAILVENLYFNIGLRVYSSSEYDIVLLHCQENLLDQRYLTTTSSYYWAGRPYYHFKLSFLSIFLLFGLIKCSKKTFFFSLISFGSCVQITVAICLGWMNLQSIVFQSQFTEKRKGGKIVVGLMKLAKMLMGQNIVVN